MFFCFFVFNKMKFLWHLYFFAVLKTEHLWHLCVISNQIVIFVNHYTFNENVIFRSQCFIFVVGPVNITLVFYGKSLIWTVSTETFWSDSTQASMHKYVSVVIVVILYYYCYILISWVSSWDSFSAAGSEFPPWKKEFVA